MSLGICCNPPERSEARDLLADNKSTKGNNMEQEFYYRASVQPTIEFFSFDSADYEPYYQKFAVLSKTKCGVWIEIRYSERGKKFINNNNRKRFAYPSKKEAWEALGFRLESYHRILKCKLDSVKAELNFYKQYIFQGN